MIIPIINPNRPPKAWWDKMHRRVASHYRSQTGRTGLTGLTDRKVSAIVGDIWYHKLSSRKRREIMSREEPALLNAGHSHSKRKGSIMARKSHKRRVSRSRIHSLMARVRSFRHNPRKRKHSTLHKSHASWAHRPVLYRTTSGNWMRPERSKLFTHSTMINPRHRRRGRRHFRHNPFRVKQLISKKYLMGTLVLGGGIAVGFLAMPVVSKLASMLKLDAHRKYFGLGHVVIGGALAMMMKRRALKELGLVIAGVGVYDLIASNVPMLGLPPISVSDWTAKLMPAASGSLDRTIAYHPTLPTVGASYQPMSASYEALGSDVEQIVADVFQ